MRRTLLKDTIVLGLMVLSISCSAIYIYQDMLWSPLTFSDTPVTNESARQMGIK